MPVARALAEGEDILPEGNLLEFITLLANPPAVSNPKPYLVWAEQDGAMRKLVENPESSASERALVERANEFDARIAAALVGDAPKYWQSVYLSTYHLDGAYQGFDVGFIREYGGPMRKRKPYLPKNWSEAGLAFRLPSGIFRRFRHKRDRGALWSIACVAFEKYEAENNLAWKGLVYG